MNGELHEIITRQRPFVPGRRAAFQLRSLSAPQARAGEDVLMAGPARFVHADNSEPFHGARAVPGRTSDEATDRRSGFWVRPIRCQSIPRFAPINLTLDKVLQAGTARAPRISPCNDFIGRYNTHYSSSILFRRRAARQRGTGTRCENLERLTYPDNTSISS